LLIYIGRTFRWEENENIGGTDNNTKKEVNTKP